MNEQERNTMNYKIKISALVNQIYQHARDEAIATCNSKDYKFEGYYHVSAEHARAHYKQYKEEAIADLYKMLEMEEFIEVDEESAMYDDEPELKPEASKKYCCPECGGENTIWGNKCLSCGEEYSN